MRALAFFGLALWCSTSSADVSSLGGVTFAKDQPHATANGTIVGSGTALPRANETLVRVQFYARCPRTGQTSMTAAKMTGDKWEASLRLLPGQHECWIEMVVDVQGGKAQQKYASPPVTLTLP